MYEVCKFSVDYSLLAARIAPVMAPLVIEFHGSSFPRTFTKPQSIMEKRPPHTAKLPATRQRFASAEEVIIEDTLVTLSSNHPRHIFTYVTSTTNTLQQQIKY